MITDKDIDTKAKEFGIAAVAVEKDYVYGWLLKEIFNRSALSPLLVLKGGQAFERDIFRALGFQRIWISRHLATLTHSC
jgi:predicted nucleotidyltransferase component of viral defense system